MIKRIMGIGAGRMYEACCALSFDKFLEPAIAETHIVSVYSFVTLTEQFHKCGIDTTGFVFYRDREIIDQYKLSNWRTNETATDTWYQQQGVKLGLLDYLGSDVLFQDVDVFAIKPYKFFDNAQPVFRTEDVWNEHHSIYNEYVEKLIGLKRTSNESYVTEFMPYLQKDWQSLKTLIETRHNTTWTEAIRNLAPFDETMWLSEYELLGIYKSATDSDNYQYVKDIMPQFHNVEQLEDFNWHDANVVKFKNRPLKYMDEQDSLKIIDYFKRITA